MNRVGPYDILGELGRGGMGVVYRARCEGSDRDVALKVIAAGEGASAEALARFQREARIATELDHPGIVKVLETGEAAGQVWFAMELVEGEPLSQQIREREFTWQEAVTIVRDVADALSVAHDKGVLHRDIEPSNILMDAEGKPHLTDFGLAKDTRTESKYTRTGQTLGTPAYMSPEQARGDLAQLTPASDVWALGCVLYELLAGRAPFVGDTAPAVIGRILTGRPDPLRESFPGLPWQVERLIGACLSAGSSRRPGDAAALRVDCDRVLRGQAPRHGGSRAWRAGAVAAALMAVLAGVVSLGVRPAARSTARAERLASQGWAERFDQPALGAEQLREALRLRRERHDWRVREGLLWWAAGRNADAVAAWRRVPDTAPEWHRAQLYLALEVAFRSRVRAEARTAIRCAQAAAVAGGDVGRLAQGVELALAGDRSGAREMLHGMRGWEAALLRAMTTGTADAQQSIREYTSALDGGIRFAWALNNRAAMRYAIEDLQGALADLDAALAIDPRSQAALMTRSAVRAELEDLRGALGDLDRLLEHYPGHVPAVYNRGVMRLQSGRRESGLADLNAVLQVKPKHLDARRARARELIRRGAVREAVADLDVVLEQAPHDLPSRERRGRARFELGDLSGALADCEAVLEVEPRAARALLYRGSVRLQQGRYAEAIKDLDIALSALPQSGLGLTNRGIAHSVLGDTAAALADLDAAVLAAPRYVEARQTRGVLRAQQGDLDGALEDLNVALAAEPAHVHSLMTRGAIRGRRRDYAGAAEDLAKALEYLPADSPQRATAERQLAHTRSRLRALSGSK